jgi:hypothetical protein
MQTTELFKIQIKEIIPNEDGSSTLVPYDTTFEPFTVSNQFVEKYNPVVDGYFASCDCSVGYLNNLT